MTSQDLRTARGARRAARERAPGAAGPLSLAALSINLSELILCIVYDVFGINGSASLFVGLMGKGVSLRIGCLFG